MARAQKHLAIIGGGPAGLMAAEAFIASAKALRLDIAVHLFDSMPSLGRKFLMAGKSGLNLTHAEDLETFLSRFGAAAADLAPLLRDFPPDAVRQFADGLGIETFVGSSGRIFPRDFKAAPLLRAWLRRLRTGGLETHMRHCWQGWDGKGALSFATEAGPTTFKADAIILALGGASWPQLGSDAAWLSLLAAKEIGIAPFRPANCGFDIAWSTYMHTRFAGQPVKSVTLSFAGETVRGEFVVTESGIEGSAVYALSAQLRDHIEKTGKAELRLDLAPDKTSDRLTHDLARPRGRNSMSNHLRKAAGIDGVKAALLRECAAADIFGDPARLAAAIKALPLQLVATRPIEEAISSAGGICLDETDERLMLKKSPGIFCAGEMLDWEAPTGGYLLNACFATGRAAGAGAAQWLSGNYSAGPDSAEGASSEPGSSATG